MQCSVQDFDMIYPKCNHEMDRCADNDLTSLSKDNCPGMLTTWICPNCKSEFYEVTKYGDDKKIEIN